jgi:hypothetical protein
MERANNKLLRINGGVFWRKNGQRAREEARSLYVDGRRQRRTHKNGTLTRCAARHDIFGADNVCVHPFNYVIIGLRAECLCVCSDRASMAKTTMICTFTKRLHSNYKRSLKMPSRELCLWLWVKCSLRPVFKPPKIGKNSWKNSPRIGCWGQKKNCKTFWTRSRG